MLERARPEDRGANFGRVASGYKNPPYLVTGIQASAFNEVQTDPSLPSANLKASWVTICCQLWGGHESRADRGVA